MKKLNLILAAGLRDKLRWALANIYYLFVLAPLVLGISYLTAGRVAENVSAVGETPSGFMLLALGALAESCLILSGVSRAAVEIYAVRLAENYFNSLPVRPITHLYAALAKRIARLSIPLGFAFAAHRSLTGSAADWDASSLFSLALLILLTAAAQAFAALCWVHRNGARNVFAVSGAAAVTTLTAALGGALMLAIFNFPDPLFGNHLYLLTTASVGLCSLLSLVGVLHGRWRALDLEHAARLQPSRRWDVASIITERLRGGSVQAQLARDIQLTARFFSAGVYLVLWLAALWACSLFVLLTTTDLISHAEDARSFFDLTWSPPVVATKIVAVLATATLAALLPLLVAYELPHLWLERAAGTSGEQLWRAKCWYARAVSFPAPLVAWAAGASTGALPAAYVIPALLECLWLWWVVSTLVGALAFEMPTKLGLALIVMLTFAVSLGALVSLVWPVGLLLYVFGVSQLAARGRARAKYFLLTGED